MVLTTGIVSEDGEHFAEVEVTNTFRTNHRGQIVGSTLHIAWEEFGHETTFYVDNLGNVKVRLIDEDGTPYEHTLGNV